MDLQLAEKHHFELNNNIKLLNDELSKKTNEDKELCDLKHEL